MFVRTIDFVNHYPPRVLCVYIISYLCVMHLFCVDIVLRKSCVDFNFISIIDSYVYIHIALVIKNYISKTPVKIRPCHILYSV